MLPISSTISLRRLRTSRTAGLDSFGESMGCARESTSAHGSLRSSASGFGEIGAGAFGAPFCGALLCSGSNFTLCGTANELPSCSEARGEASFGAFGAFDAGFVAGIADAFVVELPRSSCSDVRSPKVALTVSQWSELEQWTGGLAG